MSEIEDAVVLHEEPNLPSTTFNAESLIKMAIEKNLNVEAMERLLAMRRELKQEYAKEEYDRAMAKFQKSCPTIKKTKEVKTKTGKVAYSYAPIESIVEQVKTYLEENGFSYSANMILTTTSVKATVKVTHSGGHSEISEMDCPFTTKTDIMSQSQVVAATYTFSKRYAFCNAFGILTGDSDTDAVPEDAEPFDIDKFDPATDKVGFGKKYADAFWKDVDDGFLNYVIGNKEAEPDNILKAKRTLELRKGATPQQSNNEQQEEPKQPIKQEEKKQAEPKDQRPASTKPSTNKGVLSEQNLEKAADRIKKGEPEYYDKMVAAYDLTSEQDSKLKEAVTEGLFNKSLKDNPAPELPNSVLLEIDEDCHSMVQLDDLFKKYPQFHTNTRFADRYNRRKLEISQSK